MKKIVSAILAVMLLVGMLVVPTSASLPDVKDKEGVVDIAATLNQYLNTKNEFMLTLPDMEEGEFVLNEIMIAGNFGKYDPRQSISEKKNIAATFFRRIKNVWRFIKYHPAEVLWAPIFKIWHFVWRNIYFRIN